MSNPLPASMKMLATLTVAIFMAGCQPASPHPVPSVPQIGGDLKCSSGDHGYEDPQAGWGFCYPGTWKYTARAQASESPPGFDLALDVFNDPCGKTGCGPGEGDFAFMIVSTYDRGTSSDLSSWVDANLKANGELQPISWGNAVQAVRLPDGRRLALTAHHIVILDLHSGLLDLETAMSSRLSTWKFSF
ncbi:MAG TPA: hypothetical protein VJQ08_03010 [Candidatus Dormibacteraeota bacterium]|nr:hypothetical protein [Candidatus Dormibacteraeota bacterium]